LPYRQPDWRAMSQESSLVIVGVVEDFQRVVLPEKITATSIPRGDGTFQAVFADPKDYERGAVVRIRIEEVIKGNGKIKRNQQILIYQPSMMPKTHGEAQLVTNGRHLIFLRPLPSDKQKELAGTSIYRPTEKPRFRSFNPASAYVVVQDERGAIYLTGENADVADEVRAVLRTHR
jgi:hypothetical protein